MSVHLGLRLHDPETVGQDGYPPAWHRDSWESDVRYPAIKVYVRALMGNRCERCGHPYPEGIAKTHARGEWTPCDEQCTHGGPVRVWKASEIVEEVETGECWELVPGLDPRAWMGYHGRETFRMQAAWRILTVHHLNGVKWDCRWWNLAALCQRCHLHIQKKVVMERVFPYEHTEWFKPHAAGWYADAYLGQDLNREETLARLDELLALERLA